MTTTTEQDSVNLAARALEKLNRKSLDIEVPRNLTLVRTLEAAIAQARNAQTAESEEQIRQAEQQIDTLKQDRITGTLVPLKSSDILLLQGFVTEMALKGKEMGFELDVQLFVMAKAESCATIYLALRKRNNHAERYFTTQEEVALLDNETLKELVTLYTEHFVLTEDERKNSLGAPRS